MVDLEQIRATTSREFWSLVERLGIHSMIGVPMRVQGQAIGVIIVYRHRREQPVFSEDDLTLAQDLADRAALAIGNARLLAQVQHELAERGASISVGERQLLAFARALAAEPALLILDEATSAVDSEIEAEIQQAVAELMRGRTTIAIAHRLSTILDADEILVLHHGEVVERGVHRVLRSAGGLYDRLFRLQVGENWASRAGAVADSPTTDPSLRLRIGAAHG